MQQTTASVSVITREEIDARQSVTLPDALLFSPGVAIGRTGAEGGTASIFLNGGNSNFTKVLVDGTPINPPGGAVDFSSFTLDNVDKVEIVRGAESAIYGTDAVSGVIQVFTHRGETRDSGIQRVRRRRRLFLRARRRAAQRILGAFDYSAAASYLRRTVRDQTMISSIARCREILAIASAIRIRLRLTLRNNTSNAGIPGQTLLEPPSLYQPLQSAYLQRQRAVEFSAGQALAARD